MAGSPDGWLVWKAHRVSSADGALPAGQAVTPASQALSRHAAERHTALCCVPRPKKTKREQKERRRGETKRKFRILQDEEADETETKLMKPNEAMQLGGECQRGK